MRGLAEIVHLRTTECREAASAIAQIAAGENGDVDEPAATHVSQCLRCQAEVAASRRVLRIMRGMAGDTLDLPADGITSLLAALEAAGVDHHHVPTWAIRAAYLGGITVATAAAGAAGVLVWMNRRRLAPTA